MRCNWVGRDLASQRLQMALPMDSNTKCSNCGTEMTPGIGFRVCLSCGQHVQDTGVPESLPIDFDDLPSFLSIPWAEFQSETHALVRLHRLCDTVEILTRLLSIIALGECRRALGDKSLPRDLIDVLRSRIERPTFGQWRDILLALVNSSTYSHADPVVPELTAFVQNDLLPRMHSGGASGEAAMLRNIIELRNVLVHGPAMLPASAQFLLKYWQPWLQELRGKLSFLESSDRFPGGTELLLLHEVSADRLRGSQPSQVSSVSAPEGLIDHVVLLRDGECLDLWPLVHYCPAVTQTLEGPKQGSESSPLIYFRSESHRILYAALIGKIPIGERIDVLETFRKLFQLEERIAALSIDDDFENEINRDSELLVGRQTEIEKVKAVLKRTPSGLLWIGGPGGIGKSFLMARLAHDLRGDPRKICCIAWRFRGGDQKRCSRTAFLCYAQRKLSEWLLSRGAIREVEPPNPNSDKLAQQFASLLDLTARLGTAGQARPRVFLILDGLDEIGCSDPGFANLVLQWDRTNVVCLCAGREEESAENIFRNGNCVRLFSNGLPPMTNDDIRSMLLESGTGRLKYDFLRLDHEDGDQVHNVALQAIVDRAEGLPLFVHHVIEDLRSQHFRIQELPHRLPQGLSAYYDDLLRRMSVGDLQAVFSPLLTTLAGAKEPLSEELLNLLLERRKVLVGGDNSRKLLARALKAQTSMLRWRGTGWQIYHERFREHIQLDQARQLGQQNELAKREFVELVKDWKSLKGTHSAYEYALRQGPTHLADACEWLSLHELLLDYEFLEAKCEAGMALELIDDYSATNALPPDEWTEVNIVRDALRLSAHVVTKNPDQLAGQLWGRLVRYRNLRSIQKLLDCARSEKGGIWLRPITQCLEVPGGPLIRTLAGHTQPVSSVVIASDGRRAISSSGPSYKTLILWDLKNGTELKRFPWEHRIDKSGDVAISPDGPRAVESDAKTLKGTVKVLNPETGVELFTLTGHAEWIGFLAITPDGRRAISKSWDRTCRVWDLQRGREVSRLTGAESMAIMPDGCHAFSTATDEAVRVWNLDTGREVLVLDGRNSLDAPVAITSDGRRAVGFAGKILKVWSLETGAQLHTQTGLTDVSLVAATPDGRRVLTASLLSDTMQFFDLETGAEPLMLHRHRAKIRCLVTTPDGSKAISGSADNTLKVWDIETGTELHTLVGYGGGFNAVATAPNNRWIVAASKEHTLVVWDLETGREVRTLTGHKLAVECVAVTPDSRRIISGSYDQTLKLWDLDTGAELHTFQHTSWVRSVAVSPDGRHAVSAGDDKTLKVWNLETGVNVHTLVGHGQGIHSVMISADGGRVISREYDDSVKVWDLSTGELIRTFDCMKYVAITPDKHNAIAASSREIATIWELETGTEVCTLEGYLRSFDSLAITPNRRYAIGVRGRLLRIWDGQTGAEMHNLNGHTDKIASVTITPDGSKAISGSADKTLRVWDIESGTDVRTLVGHAGEIRCIAITPDGNRIVSASTDRTLKIWDLKTGTELRTLRGHTGSVECVAIMPDGLAAISGSSDYTLKIWDLDHLPHLNLSKSYSESDTLRNHTKAISFVAFAPGGHEAVSGSYDRTVRVWDPNTGALLRTLSVPALFGAITPEGTHLVSASFAHNLSIVDLRTGKEFRTLEGRAGALTSVAITSDGRRAVAGSISGCIQMWDLESGTRLQAFQGHEKPIWSVTVAPDGRAISVSEDRTMKVWDLERNKCIWMVRDHEQAVTCVAISPDGGLGISGSRDSTLKLWNLKTHSRGPTLAGHTSWISSLAITSDACYAVSVSNDKTLAMWDLKSGRCRVKFGAGGSLTSCCVSPDGRMILAGDGSGRLHFLYVEGTGPGR